MIPRMFGGGLLLTLSDFGIIPKMDVIPVKRFDAVWPAADARAVTLQRLTLEDEFQGHHEDGTPLLQRFLRPTMLQVRDVHSLTCLCWRPRIDSPSSLDK
jgi:hypothetical protein